MSGDVQPRKRKDKKKKKDELGVEEPRGTAAALGEGDVFMHSQHEHGTGGHWCAKIIFFSLLAILITLIGLIILENRGLTELEANSVQSQYSGVLEGWLEDAQDDDHHDEHTLELKHPDDHHDDDHEQEIDDEDEEHDDEHEEHDDEHEDEEHGDVEHEDDEHDDDDEHDIESDEEDEEHDTDIEEQDDDDEQRESDEIGDDEQEIEEQETDEKGDDKQNLDIDVGSEENEDTNEEVEEINYIRYTYNKLKYNIDDDDDDDDDQIRENQESEKEDNMSDEIDDNNNRNIYYGHDDNEYDQNKNIDSNEIQDLHYIENQQDDEQQEDYDDEQDDVQQNGDDNDDVQQGDENYEEEKEQEDDDEDEGFEEEIEKIEKEIINDEDSTEVPPTSSLEDRGEQEESKEDEVEEADEDEDFLDADDDEPPVERITTPSAGKPFVEIEEEIIEKPIDTLAEEEAYERRQEELRREESQVSQMWLKLAVGSALLAATHVVLRRAAAPRDAPEPEERAREETPSLSERRMTLISEEHTKVVQEKPQSPPPRQIIDDEIFKKPAPVVQAAPILKQNIEPVLEKKTLVEEQVSKDDKDKELYSDEDEEVEEEEEEEEEDIIPTKITPQQKTPVVQKEDSEPEEVPDDVEIIDDEQIEEEEEDVEDEEEISDVDDTELLSRLEAKYGRLPEPERPGKYKEAGNSIEDDWPGEPSDSYWRQQLDIAEEELRQGAWASSGRRVGAPALAHSGRARWLAARSLDVAAEQKRDNQLLSKAITAYLHLLKMNERLSDKKLLEVAHRAIDRIQFRGTYLNAEPIYRLLIRRFPDDINYRNNLTVSFLMANRADLADEVLKETLQRWPNDRIALAHRGFVLKNHHKKLEEAVVYLSEALKGDAGAANEARFHYHLGDALLQLGRREEADAVHERGAALGHFPSAAQRSLYNVPRLRARPWWRPEDTPYSELIRTLEASWREILKEGAAASALYEQEKEGLRERGAWSQLDVFVRGREVGGRCARTPTTCAAVRAEPAAAACRRGQIKFSALEAGTHVRAHVGPTNCRLRIHLALNNTEHTYIRVHNETRQWQVGKTLIFDDSFEHEVWHNGTGTRLVLIVDVWHPDLTPAERHQLPAI